MPAHHSPIAQPFRREEIPVLAVYFDEPVPEKFPGHEPGVDIVRPAQAWYRDQADALVLAMERHCPGGFMDALLGSLLSRKASVYVVPDVIVGAPVSIEDQVWHSSPQPVDGRRQELLETLADLDSVHFDADRERDGD